jgi:hypothetical protein
MRVYNWSARVDDVSAYKRVSGRNHYNAVRKHQATLRRAHLLEILLQYSLGREPYQRGLACQLGVSQVTISRDLRVIRRPPPAPTTPLPPLPTAGGVVVYNADKKSEAWPVTEPQQTVEQRPVPAQPTVVVPVPADVEAALVGVLEDAFLGES